MIVRPKTSDFASVANVPMTSKYSMKVLHLINGEHFSGAERVQDLLAMALPEFGYEVGFVCLKADRFPSTRQSTNCPLHVIKMRNKLDFFSAARVVRLARRGGYSILHAHTPRSLMIGRMAARKLRCPLIYHVHSPVGRDSSKSLHNRINTWMESWNLRDVDQMICVSQSLAEYMAELGHDRHKISVVRNGVPAIDELPVREPKKEKWTLGTMALFRPRKGIEVLLEAVSILKQKNVAVHLRAVGPFETADYQAQIKELVQNLDIADRVTWTGFQKDVNGELAKMDLFILPSLYGEGLPMVVLEAMAAGVPVVASRVEGIPEAVRDQVDGLIFEPGSAICLAAEIEDLFGNTERWRSMSLNARERQRSQLSDRSMAAGVAGIYDSILVDRKGFETAALAATKMIREQKPPCGKGAG